MNFKKLTWVLIILVICSFICYASNDNTTVYESSYTDSQGINNWYFCEFSGDETKELVYNADRYWKPESGTSYPTFGPSDSLKGYMTPHNNIDAGFRFFAPKQGMVRIKGRAYMPQSNADKGNGVTVKIYKGEKLLWSKQISYGVYGDYDLTTSIRTEEELYFRVSSNGSNAFDTVVWWPTVEYLNAEYVHETSEGEFCQKKDDEIKALEYNAEKDGFLADDGIAFVTHNKATVSEEYSLLRRWKVEEDGRYRVKGIVEAVDTSSGGHVLTVYKNGEQIWQQMFPDGETGKYDVRMLAEKCDIIDVELDRMKYTGQALAKWTCYVSEFYGTIPFCHTISSAGHTYSVIKEFSLGSLIGTSQGDGSVYYSIRNDVAKEMIYDTAEQKWKSCFGDTGEFISKTEISPGRNTDVVFETTVIEGGTIRISGNMKGEFGDGVLSKVYINDELLWSSRVGGERYVRWDEPYDTSYFVNYIDVVSKVNVGDKIKFTFNQWRKCENDVVDISDVKISYIKGDALSETTKWKLSNSIVIDTLRNCVYHYGNNAEISVVTENGVNYASQSDIVKIFGEDADLSGEDKLSISDVAESKGLNVAYAGDRLMIIHQGIPVLYSYSELSEIAVKLEENTYTGDLRWDFAMDSEGFKVNPRAEIIDVKDGVLTARAIGVSGQNHSIELSGLNLDLSQYNYIRIRMKNTTKSTEEVIYLQDTDSKYHQAKIATDAVADTDFVDYVIPLSDAIKSNPLKYKLLRFDFIINIAGDKALAYIDSIVISKYNTPQKTAMVSSVKVGDTQLLGISKEYSKIEMPYEVYQAMTTENILVEIESEYKYTAYAPEIKVTDLNGRKYIDIFVKADNELGNSRNYRIECRIADFECRINERIYNEDNKTLTVKFALRNNTADTKQAMAIIGVYDANKVIKSVLTFPDLYLKGEMQKQVVFTDYTYQNGDSLKLFFWDKVDTIQPITNADKVSV